jgi:hypothetical protein
MAVGWFGDLTHLGGFMQNWFRLASGELVVEVSEVSP